VAVATPTGVMGSGLVRLCGVLPAGAVAELAASGSGHSGGGAGAGRCPVLGHGLRWAREQSAAAAVLLASLADAPCGGEGPAERGCKLGSLIAAGVEAAGSGPSASTQQLLVAQLMALLQAASTVAATAHSPWVPTTGSAPWAAPTAAAVSALATCRAVCELRRQLAEGSWGGEAHTLVPQALLAAGLSLAQVKAIMCSACMGMRTARAYCAACWLRGEGLVAWCGATASGCIRSGSVVVFKPCYAAPQAACLNCLLPPVAAVHACPNAPAA
jgi:hypothetical protein